MILKKGVVLILGVLLLTGCNKEEINITKNTDNKITNKTLEAKEYKKVKKPFVIPVDNTLIPSNGNIQMSNSNDTVNNFVISKNIEIPKNNEKIGVVINKGGLIEGNKFIEIDTNKKIFDPKIDLTKGLKPEQKIKASFN